MPADPGILVVTSLMETIFNPASYLVLFVVILSRLSMHFKIEVDIRAQRAHSRWCDKMRLIEMPDISRFALSIRSTWHNHAANKDSLSFILKILTSGEC
jgi:hypothetical protein